MKMLELTKEQFEEFASNTPYNNYCQTDNYGKVMTTKGFNYNFIGYTTNDNEILAAGMFLTKRIGKTLQYAYCPKGFIIDYDNSELLKKFTHNLIKFYKKKNIIFLKINPEIHYLTIDTKNGYGKTPTKNISILEELKKLGFKKRKESEPLQLIEPKIKAIIDLKKYNNDESKSIAKDKGLKLEPVDNIDAIYNLIKDNCEYNIDYYKSLVENFKKTNQIDLLVLKINYEKFLINATKKVEEEEYRNNLLNEKLQKDTSEENLEEKMKSDELLEKYKQDVVGATNGLKNNNNATIAAAIIIKYANKINIIVDGYDKNFHYMNPIYHLYNEIFEMYKENFDEADLNAIADDFSEESSFKDYNSIKLSFNPTLKEYIGELDLVISNWKFKIAEKNNLLSQEFTKKRY